MKRIFLWKPLLFIFILLTSASASAQVTWQVQSDYFGERNAIAQPRTTRSVALSDDGASVYTGLIQSPNTGSTSLRKVKSSVLAVPGTDHVIFGNGMPGGTGTFAQVGGQPVYADQNGAPSTFEGWIDVGNGPEGIDADDRGNVYVALQSGISNASRVDIFNSNLTAQVGSISVPSPTGVHIYKTGGIYYAYVVSNNGLQRWNVTAVNAPVLDVTYNPGVIGPRSLTVDADGTVFAVGVGANQIERVSAAGVVTHTTTILNAAGVAVFKNKLYIIKRQSPTQPIVVLNKADLSSAGPDIVTPALGASRGDISQFTSIDVNAQGRLYVSEENYTGATSGTNSGALVSYTPPATSFNPTPGPITGRIYFDRVLISSPVEPDSDGDGVLDVDDCAPNDPTRWRTGTFYVDADADGFTVGNGVTLCYGNATPAGYSATQSAADDCNDNDPNVWHNGTFYVDNDGDGYTVGNGVTLCYGNTTPAGYTSTKSATDDCNDNDPNVWHNGTFYVDNDGDGYTVGNGVTLCYGNITPAGYTSTKSATDDCNDNDPTVHTVQTWYQDQDNDGYAGTTAQSCSMPAGSGWSTTPKPVGDCNDTNPAVHSSQTYYRDADGDGYGDATNSISSCSSTPPAGYVSNNYDCDDNKKEKKPEDNQVVMCHNGKSQCAPAKDIVKHQNEGWTLGPCTPSNCGPDETLMCHNGSTECVKNKDVQKNLQHGWTLGACPNDGGNSISGNLARIEEEVIIPNRYSLSNYPNPFSGLTKIRYDIPVDSRVTISVFNLMGKQITTLVSSEKKAGTYTVDFNASGLSSGVYYYKIDAVAGGRLFTQTQKLSIAK